MTSTAPARTPSRTAARRRVGTASVLVAAFAVAAVMCWLLAAADRLPDGMVADDPRLWAFHLVGFGVAALALLDRRWAHGVVAALTAGYIVFGVRMYAALLAPGLLTAVGWFGNDVHVGLLVLAEVLSLRRLLGTGPA